MGDERVTCPERLGDLPRFAGAKDTSSGRASLVGREPAAEAAPSGSPLKVLHVTEGFDGGVVTFLKHVLPAQRAAGLDVSLACCPRRSSQQQEDLDYLREAGVRVHQVPMARGPHPLRDLSALATLVSILKEQSFDWVHTHCFKGGLLGRLATRFTPVPAVIHTPHCFPFMRERSRLGSAACRGIERALGRWTDCLMLVSESERLTTMQILAGVPSVVIPNGLPPQGSEQAGPLQALRHELELPQDVPVVGTLCRLTRYKCVDHLILAAASVRKRVPEARFVIAGDGPDRGRLKRLVRSLGLNEAVHLIGYRRDADRLLRLFDVCALCSQAEGMPYVLLEAMRAGVAVVASNVPGSRDLIENARTGLLYEWGRVDHLAHCILRCLADRALTHQLTQQARRYVADGHTLDSQVAAMLDLYRRLVLGSGTTRIEPATTAADSVQNSRRRRRVGPATAEPIPAPNDPSLSPLPGLLTRRPGDGGPHASTTDVVAGHIDLGLILMWLGSLLLIGLAHAADADLRVAHPLWLLPACLWLLRPVRGAIASSVQAATFLYLIWLTYAAVFAVSMTTPDMKTISLRVSLHLPATALIGLGLLMNRRWRPGHLFSIEHVLLAILLIAIHALFLLVLLHPFYGFGWESDRAVLGRLGGSVIVLAGAVTLSRSYWLRASLACGIAIMVAFGGLHP